MLKTNNNQKNTQDFIVYVYFFTNLIFNIEINTNVENSSFYQNFKMQFFFRFQGELVT